METGIYRRPDGRLKVRATGTCPKTGKMRDRSRMLPPDATLLEARAEITRLRSQIATGAALDLDAPPRPTVADYAETWMARKRRHLKPTAQRDYTLCVEAHILPYLGEIYADALRRSDVEEWVGWASAKTLEDGRPYAAATVQGWWRVLVQLTRDLAADHDLADPTRRVRSPRLARDPRRERRTLGPRQLGDMLQAVEAFAPTRYAEVLTLALTGMRAGELYGLEWRDLDEAAQCLHVQRSYSSGHLTTPKTSAGHRQCGVHPHLLETLRAHRAAQVAAQHPGLEEGIVFPSDRGTRRHPSSLTKTMRLCARHAGIEQGMSPQVLRRTFNSLLVVADVDRLVLRSQMGHTREELTARYSSIRLETKLIAVRDAFEGVELGCSLGCDPNKNAPDTQVKGVGGA